MTYRPLEGQRALITGANSGIGKAITYRAKRAAALMDHGRAMSRDIEDSACGSDVRRSVLDLDRLAYPHQSGDDDTRGEPS
jgi:NAD(P)-dependent dehydrogenase (short-subunit alcohol dehydrogenase family)